MSPGQRERPAGAPGVSEVTAATDTSVQPRPLCRPHLRRHWCYVDVKRHRRNSAELTRLLADLYPQQRRAS